MGKLLSIICINFHTEQKIIELINSIPKNNITISVFIVDNSKSIGTKSEISNYISELNFITLITPAENLGYFGGAEYALKEHYKQITKSKWVAISNPDIILQENFIENLAKLKNTDSIGVIAPKIINRPSGINSNPYMLNRPSTRTIRWYIFLYSNPLLYYFYNLLHNIKKTINIKTPKKQKIPPKNIYAAHGSFMIFSENYFINAGNFNYKSFLFAEEIFVAEEARKMGLTITYNDTLSVEHHEHASTSFLPNKKMARYMLNSYKVIYNKYFK